MNNELYHYNHNHDSLGRFSSSGGSSGFRSSSSGSNKKSKNNSRSSRSLSGTFKRKKSKNNVKKGKASNTKLSKNERDRLVNKGSLKEIKANKNRLSNRELESAITRLEREKAARVNLDKRLSSLDADTKKKGIDKVGDVMNTVGKLNNYAQTGINSWNTIAKIHNSLSENEWPELKGHKTNKEIQNVIRSGSRDAIKANKSKMTYEQYQEAVNRLDLDRKLNKQDRSEKIDKIIRSGNADQIWAHRNDMSSQELKEASQRLKNQDEIVKQKKRQTKESKTIDELNKKRKIRGYK